MTQTSFQEIAAEIQLFNTLEQKENFPFLLGALTSFYAPPAVHDEIRAK